MTIADSAVMVTRGQSQYRTALVDEALRRGAMRGMPSP